MEISHDNYKLLKDKKLSRLEIANYFNIPEWKLKKIIAKEGWGKEIPVIEFPNIFQEFDEYSCYWAGFLAADGNVDSKSRIRLMLKYDDMGHLEKFKELLGSTHLISYNTDKYNRCSFEFTQKNMCRDLKDNFFIVPNKTDKLKFPDHLNVEQLRHYIRGYFDGDGSICESFSNKNSITATIYATFATGSKEFGTLLYSYLNNTLGITGNLQDYGTKQQLKYTTNSAKILLTWLYNSSEIYLDRKYKLFQTLVIENNRSTRVLDKGIVQSRQ